MKNMIFKFSAFLVVAVVPLLLQADSFNLDDVPVEHLKKEHQLMQADSIDIKDITTEPLTIKNKDWFIEEFVKAYMKNYEDKVFVIDNQGGSPIVVGPHDTELKRNFLLHAAKESFDAYVESPGPHDKGFIVKYKGVPVRAWLYQIFPDSKTVLLAEGFTVVNFREKGLEAKVILNVFPKMYPDYKNYVIFVRQQDGKILLFYDSIGFSVGDIKLSERYGSHPLRYMGFCKTIPCLE